MNVQQRIRQQQACHIRFKELEREGVIPRGLSVYDYARQIVGREVESLKQLENWELNALRDRLEGKPNKVFVKLKAAAKLAGIENLDSWMREMSASEAFAYLRGFSAETLPINSQWRLCQVLETRGRPRIGSKIEEPKLF